MLNATPLPTDNTPYTPMQNVIKGIIRAHAKNKKMAMKQRNKKGPRIKKKKKTDPRSLFCSSSLSSIISHITNHPTHQTWPLARVQRQRLPSCPCPWRSCRWSCCSGASGRRGSRRSPRNPFCSRPEAPRGGWARWRPRRTG